jgi:hypothetical protein
VQGQVDEVMQDHQIVLPFHAYVAQARRWLDVTFKADWDRSAA